ncbi:MAG: hypothetical protein GY844_24640, partial [Bradyrhizobium sp.]|nr:hypothetical protein [Bradyrhizobium sp.]
MTHTIIVALAIFIVVLTGLSIYGVIPALRIVPDDTKFDFMRFRRISFPISALLSLLAIAGYLWMRFGSIEFGLAGIIALYHDVAITLSCVMACHTLHDTAVGRLIGLEDFKID